MKGYQRLSQIREAAGYSIQDIASVLNTTTHQVRKWEKGQARIKLSKCIILARLYNLSLDYIAGLTDIPLKLK